MYVPCGRVRGTRTLGGPPPSLTAVAALRRWIVVGEWQGDSRLGDLAFVPSHGAGEVDHEALKTSVRPAGPGLPRGERGPLDGRHCQ